MDEGLAGELQCPVCLELLTWPIILPCSHVLCRAPCADRLFDHGFVRCPVCRDNSFVSGGIQNLPRVISLEHIIEHFRQPLQPALPPVPPEEEVEVCGENDIPCQLCEGETPKRATKSCLHCNASYCQQCLRMSHPNRSPFNDHKLIEPKKYSKPKELRCLQHDVMVNIFCEDCQSLGCLLCADDKDASHAGHKILSLRQAAASLKVILEANLESLEKNLKIVEESINHQNTTKAALQQCVTERRAIINEQCDSLINEVETKREFFLSDLEYEEKSKTDSLTQQTGSCQQQATSLQNLIHHTREVLRETEDCAFVQLAKSVSDKVSKNLQKMTRVSTKLPSYATMLNQKVVDFRKEKAIIKDLAYLTVPSIPRIDMSKCSRSTSSVVLVLGAPLHEIDVVDGYKVFYSTDRERNPDTWHPQKRSHGNQLTHRRLSKTKSISSGSDPESQETMDFKTPGETRKCGRGPQSDGAICLMHDNLESGTVYYFGVIAYNATGQSEMSEVIQCHTLSASQMTLPVPQIVECQCRTYTYSIQLHSPSPLDDPPDSGIAHYLLYREASVNKIWKSISLYGRVDHRVFGLEPDTMYDFVIMACDKNSECQVSNMVTMKTERSAY